MPYRNNGLLAKHPQFHVAYRKMLDAFSSRCPTREDGRTALKPWTDAMRSLNHDDLSDDARLVRAAFWYNQVFLSDGKSRGAEELCFLLPEAYPELLNEFDKNPALSTRLLYAFNFPTALHHLQQGRRIGVSPSLIAVDKIIRASGCFQEFAGREAGQSLLFRRTSRNRVTLPHADEISRRLGLTTHSSLPEKYIQVEGISVRTDPANSHTPTEDILISPEIKKAAIRAIAIILFYAWQRFRSLRLVELRHIIVSPSYLDLVIPDSKGGWRMLRLPISRLAPADECAFLRNFQATAYSLGFSPSTRLTQMADMGIIHRRGHGSRQSYRNALRILGRLHDPRRVGLSLAPIRALVARRPELLHHPYFPEFLKSHWWFSRDGLDAFLKLLPSDQTDSVEVFRRIAGWTDYKQFFSTYCRTWHIITALQMASKT